MNTMHAQLSTEEFIQQVQLKLLNAHKNPDQFINGLTAVSEHLSADAAFMWMARRDKSQKRWYLSSADHSFFENIDFRIKYPKLCSKACEENGLAIDNISASLQEFSQEAQQLISHGLNSIALYPVYWSSDSPAFMLGVINYDPKKEPLYQLKSIALTFLMAVSHYENYRILSKMGKIDTMTGLRNRNSYQIAISEIKKKHPHTCGCVYIDVNGLHEVNNYLGHHAGDDMLRTIAKVIQKYFGEREAFRIGGDEFIILCQNIPRNKLETAMLLVREDLQKSNYEISFGIAFGEESYQLDDLIDDAEMLMRTDKQRYYEKGGSTRNFKHINKQLEKLLGEKHDADMFLAVLRPEFKGVYFVDLDTDTLRHLFIPDYFEELLSETNDVFSDALLEYAHRYVKDSYFQEFEKVCNYNLLRERLDGGDLPSFLYQKKDGETLRLNIVRLQSDSERKYRTLWTFSDPDILKN